MGDPHVPARRDHHAVRRAAAEPRPPHRVGDPRREAFAAAADPQAVPRAAQRRRHGVAGRPAGAQHRQLGGAPAEEASRSTIGGYDPRLGARDGRARRRARAASTRARASASPSERGRGQRVLRHRRPSPAGSPTDLLDGIDAELAALRCRRRGYARAIAEAQPGARPRSPRARAAGAGRARAPSSTACPRIRGSATPAARSTRRSPAAAGVYARATAATAGRRARHHASTSPSSWSLAPRRSRCSGSRPPARRRSLAAIALTVGDEQPAKTRGAAAADTRTPSPAYWLARPPTPGHYVVGDPTLIGAAARAARARGRGRSRDRRPHECTWCVPVVHAWTDPVHGERTRPFAIVPPATVTPLRDAVMAPGAPRAAGARGCAPAAMRSPRSRARAARRLDREPASQPVTLAKIGDETTVPFDVTPAPRRRGGRAPARWSDRRRRVVAARGRDRLPAHPAAGRAAAGDGAARAALAQAPGRPDRLRPGSGDSIAADLAHVGLAVDELDDDALRTGDLSRYAAIVVGIRAYNTRDVVRVAHARLMAYVEHGGTVVVQYNTLDFEGPDRSVPARARPRPDHRRERRGDVSSIPGRACCTAPTSIDPPTSTAGCRSAASTSRPSGTRATSRCSGSPIPARGRSTAAVLVAQSRQGPLHLHRPRVLPPAARRRAGRVSAVRQPDRRRQVSDPRRAAAVLGRWRRLYVLVARRCSLVETAAVLAAHPVGGRDRLAALDWVVLVGTIAIIVVYGAWRTRGVRDVDSYFRGESAALADDRPQHHGHPGQRDHVPVDAGPGLRTTACASCSSTSACRWR